MDWKPDEKTLKEIILVLITSYLRGDYGTQTERRRKLEEWREKQHFNRYLLLILVDSQITPKVEVRQFAGILLKNNLRRETLNEEELGFLKHLLEGLDDSIKIISRTTAAVISTIISRYGLYSFPNIFKDLIKRFFTKSPELQENYVDCIKLIIEDNKNSFPETPEATSPYHDVIPFLIEILGREEEQPNSTSIQVKCLRIISTILSVRDLHVVIRECIPKLLSLVTKISKKDHPNIQKEVCRIYCIILSQPRNAFGENFSFNRTVLPFSVDIITKGVRNGTNRKSIFAALEIWENLLLKASGEEKEMFLNHIEPILEKVIPSIFDCMVFYEFDRIMIEEEINQDSPIDVDIGTEWNLRRLSSTVLDNLSQNVKNNVIVEKFWKISLSEISKRIKDEKWHVREGAILALGALKMSDPHLGRNRKSLSINLTQEEQEKDTKEHHEGYLSDFLEYLVKDMIPKEQHLMVKGMSFWTFGRYTLFIIKKIPKLLSLIINLCVESILNKNDLHSQELSLNCLTVLLKELKIYLSDNEKKKKEEEGEEEEEEEEGINHEITKVYEEMYPKVIETISKCLTLGWENGHKNLMTLYDTIAVIASEGIPDEKSRFSNPLSKASYEKLFLPLSSRFRSNVQNEIVGVEFSEIMISEAEALATMVNSLFQSSSGTGFGSKKNQVLVELWETCEIMIREFFTHVQRVHQNGEYPPNHDILVMIVDLMNIIMEKFGFGCNKVLEGLVSSPQFLDLLVRCLGCNNHSVKTVSFGMLGDFSENCVEFLLPRMEEIINIMINDLNNNVDVMSVMNNVLWSLGRVASQARKWKGMANTLEENICPALLQLIGRGRGGLNISVESNLVVTVSRLALSFPEVMSGWFNRMFPVFLMAEDVTERDEIRDLFLGLSILIIKEIEKDSREKEKESEEDKGRRNEILINFVRMFPTLIAEFVDPPIDLRGKFTNVLESFKKFFGLRWRTIYEAQLTPECRLLLNQKYNFKT